LHGGLAVAHFFQHGNNILIKAGEYRRGVAGQAKYQFVGFLPKIKRFAGPLFLFKK
jgi:hypothetical protein